jgi:hypothetical protein
VDERHIRGLRAGREFRDQAGARSTCEDADHPIYIQTIPKRGYKFVAPVEVVGSQTVQAPPQARTDGTLSKLLWSHIAELRIAEDRRKKRRRAALIGASVAIGVALIATIIVLMMRGL